jgi:pre-mRNA-processing factor 17
MSDDGSDVFPLPAAKKSRLPSPRALSTDPAPHVLQHVCPSAPLLTRPTDTQIHVNIPYHDLILPIHGPDNPFADRNRFLIQNALAGHVEQQAMSDHAFNAQHLTHAILGYSANPSVDPTAPAVLGALDTALQNGRATIDAMRPTNAQKRDLKRKRKHKGTLDVVDGDGAYVGPWAAWDGEDQAAFLDGVEADDPGEQPDEDEAPEPVVVRKKANPKRGGPGQESSVFHGKSTTDYQGRTYMHPPLADAPHLSTEAGSQETFIPKACIHTWTGHTQGVSAIRLFPDTGHLLLSASMDTKIKARDASPLLVRADPVAALGRLYPWKLSPDLPRPPSGRQGCHLFKRRHQVPVLWLRSSSQAMGHRDRPVSQALQQRQDSLRRPLPPRR